MIVAKEQPLLIPPVESLFLGHHAGYRFALAFSVLFNACCRFLAAVSSLVFAKA